jgi:hypothetical protein
MQAIKFKCSNHNVARDHPLDFIIGDISRGVQTRSRLTSFCEHFSFVSSIEPEKINEALKDVDWVNAMHEELNNFKRNQLWDWNQMSLSQQARSRWDCYKKQSKISGSRLHSS